ncbi:hypothetical protein AmDm5_0037 [Acetobacter malorum]|nr:hypothetical protein AmDm5_0037 [Acetobacter malorum]
MEKLLEYNILIKHEGSRSTTIIAIFNDNNFAQSHPLPCFPHIPNLSPPTATIPILQFRHHSVSVMFIHRKNP